MVSEGTASGTRVLVVENEYFLAADLASMIDDCGAIVVGPVGTMEQARALVAEKMVDCAVVDINLMDGPDFRLAHYLRDAGIPFVFATGYDNTIIADDFADVPLYQKPVDSKSMVQALLDLHADRGPRDRSGD
ncbi:response regulator [Sphingomonas morindae]|uniref:Response regulator n=1 Tax=Sphingomonas morindae TaxID=1541170 RepID=A0ABY4X5C7_9SPHN|nr:response regulator [Sphingomonas morindae]USI72087.1 response regulator [Sphingomonas morindae]